MSSMAAPLNLKPKPNKGNMHPMKPSVVLYPKVEARKLEHHSPQYKGSWCESS